MHPFFTLNLLNMSVIYYHLSLNWLIHFAKNTLSYFADLKTQNLAKISYCLSCTSHCQL